MMIQDYGEMCVTSIKSNLANMFDYAVNDCHCDIDLIATTFVRNEMSKQYEIKNSAYVMGISGIELARIILDKIYNEPVYIKPTIKTDKSPEYWAGWVIGDYQCYSNYRYKDIFEKVKMSDVVDLYKLYHEIDITHFYEYMDEKMSKKNPETKLKRIREARGLSQANLAKIANVQLRSIQMYEQRKNDINKAQAQTLYKLSMVLGCNIEDLLEMPK